MTKPEQRLLKRMIDQTQFNAIHADNEAERNIWRNQHDALCLLNGALIDQKIAAREKSRNRKPKPKKE